MTYERMSSPLRTLRFQKRLDGETLDCTIEEFEDGAYVCCDEFEVIVEFADDAMEEAIRYVTDAGYHQVTQ